MICIFLDSNMLYSRSLNFTTARFVEKLDELIGEIEVNDLYGYVKIVIPQITVSELRKQQIDDFSTVTKDLKKTRLTEQVIEIPENYEDICDEIFSRAIEQLRSGTVSVEIAPYPPDAALQGLIQRAIRKEPPFEGKEKQTDKGFKDALIWESLLEYKRQNRDSDILLYSKDNRMMDAFLEREYQQVFGEKIQMVYRTNMNSHQELLERLRTLTGSKDKEQAVSFLQQLKNQLIQLLQDTSAEYLIDYPKSFECGGETLLIDGCTIREITITDESEEQDIITFILSLSMGYTYTTRDGGMGILDVESAAAANYCISEEKFYLQAIEDIEGIYIEYDGPGLELPCV